MRRAVVVLTVVLLAGCQVSSGQPEATQADERTPTPRAAISPRPTVQPTGRPTASPTAEPTAATTPAPAFGARPQGPTIQATVVSITDGDTIRVVIDGSEYPLRYIGIDSPETGGAHATEATAANASRVEGKTVFLESDVNDTDRFDRLLRYVWLAQGSTWLLVNREQRRLPCSCACSRAIS